MIKKAYTIDETAEKMNISTDEVCELIDNNTLQAYEASNGEIFITANSVYGFIRGAKAPTLDEVREYVNYKGLQIDPEEFYHHYTNRGWRVRSGERITKSWRDIAESWERRQANNH